MFRQLSRQPETNSSLDFPTGDGGLLVVLGKTRSFSGNPLKDVIDKRVHDAHGFAGDTSLRMNLLQHLVDVDGIAFLAVLSPLLLVSRHLGFGGSFLFAFLASYFAWHGCFLVTCFGIEVSGITAGTVLGLLSPWRFYFKD